MSRDRSTFVDNLSVAKARSQVNPGIENCEAFGSKLGSQNPRPLAKDARRMGTSPSPSRWFTLPGFRFQAFSSGGSTEPRTSIHRAPWLPLFEKNGEWVRAASVGMAQRVGPVRLLLRRFARRRRQLLHHAESIPVVPALDELAVAQTSNRDACQ
jgi:hypothetical protein